MYGKNAVYKRMPEFDPNEEPTYQVREIFSTIQGEGPYAGIRAVFIRLSGCNLRCHFCDTSWNEAIDPFMTIPRIIAEVEKVACTTIPTGNRLNNNITLIVITGGEPLLQPLKALITSLTINFRNTAVQIETAGTIFQPIILHPAVKTVVSPKTPKVDEGVAEIARAYKYIISAKDEFCGYTGIPITATQVGVERKERLAMPPAYLRLSDVYLSPCEGDGEDSILNYRKMVELSQKFGYRASVRLHTIFGLR